MSNSGNTPVTENTFDSIQNKIANLEQQGLNLPANYSPSNALRSAWLMLQETQTRDKKPVLEACSKQSIANAVLKMVVNGLNPQKKQCYFIPYGNQLECMTSYFGNVAIGKRAGLKDVRANLIRKGDEFDYEIDSDGRVHIKSHNQKFENLNKDVIGAYAVVEYPDGKKDATIMTMQDIEQSWKQGATKGNSPAHKNFDGEMAKRTVTNRAIKMFVNSSDDSSIIDDGEHPDEVRANVDQRIENHSGKKEINLEADKSEPEALPEKEQKQAPPKRDPQPEKKPQTQAATNGQTAMPNF